MQFPSMVEIEIDESRHRREFSTVSGRAGGSRRRRGCRRGQTTADHRRQTTVGVIIGDSRVGDEVTKARMGGRGCNNDGSREDAKTQKEGRNATSDESAAAQSAELDGRFGGRSSAVGRRPPGSGASWTRWG